MGRRDGSPAQVRGLVDESENERDEDEGNQERELEGQRPKRERRLRPRETHLVYNVGIRRRRKSSSSWSRGIAESHLVDWICFSFSFTSSTISSQLVNYHAKLPVRVYYRSGSECRPILPISKQDPAGSPSPLQPGHPRSQHHELNELEHSYIVDLCCH